MNKNLHFCIIDDDDLTVAQYANLFQKAGHQISRISGKNAFCDIQSMNPDAVICDLLHPHCDGLALLTAIRKTQNIFQPVFIAITSQPKEADRLHALEIGVDGYFAKPLKLESFLDDMLEIVSGKMSVHFWGCRGTLPVPGKRAIHYGGNTSCVTLYIGKQHFLIFDAGTGIKELSNYLVKENKLPLSAKIFISHPHYDHINGFPYFVPLYMEGNEFEVFGANNGASDIESLISGQMDGIYFPVTTKQFSATLNFHNLTEENFQMGDVHIQTMYLSHPGHCLGYRVQYKNKAFCYITDNELYLKESPEYDQGQVDRLINFVADANVLVLDATYTDEEYLKKIGWGHSCVKQAVQIAAAAKVKLLCLHHHDPDQTDQDIDLKLAQANEFLKSLNSKTLCIAPHEGDDIEI